MLKTTSAQWRLVAGYRNMGGGGLMKSEDWFIIHPKEKKAKDKEKKLVRTEY